MSRRGGRFARRQSVARRVRRQGELQDRDGGAILRVRFGDPLPGLTDSQVGQFLAGQDQFAAVETP